MQRSTILVLSTIAAAALVVARVAAQGVGLLDGVRVSEENGAATVTIDVSERVRYLSHALSPSGTVLQVRLRRVDTSSDDTDGISGRDNLVPTGNEARLVGGISYEGGAGDEGTLIVRFTRSVRPTVYQRGDQQSISISLPADSGSLREPSPVPGPELSPAPAAGGAGSAASVPPASAMPEGTDAPISGAMEGARRAMIAKDYTTAVQLLHQGAAIRRSRVQAGGAGASRRGSGKEQPPRARQSRVRGIPTALSHGGRSRSRSPALGSVARCRSAARRCGESTAARRRRLR